MHLRRRVVLAGLAVAGCAGVRRDDPLAAMIAPHVARGFSGVVLYARGDAAPSCAAYGALGGRAVAPDDRFWLASTGKQFASAAILLLRDEARLALDAPIGAYLSVDAPDKSAITVRQLLTHTSGLAQSYVSEQQETRGAAVAAMLAEPLAGPPGERFRYANSNYQLAAAIVETVSGASYRDFVRARLWAPAGLTRSGFAGADASSLVSPTLEPLPPRLARAYWGEQGVFATAGDLAAWMRALRAGTVLAPASVDELFAGAVAIGEGRAALGWFENRSPRGRRRVFTRGNEDFGANSLIYLYPEDDVLIIVLTHAGDAPDGSSWSRLIHREIEAALAL